MQIYVATRIHASHCDVDQKDWEGRVPISKELALPLEMPPTITRKKMVWAMHSRGTVPG